MKECCRNCKYNKRDFSKPPGEGYSEFCCGNEDGENYSVPTFFDDTCDDFEECDGRENAMEGRMKNENTLQIGL